MAKVTAQEYAAKWAQRLSGATEDIRRGISRVSEAPGVKAAAQKDLMKQKILQAIDDGTWSAQVAGVTLEDWKKAASGKGVDRITSGVNAAKDKQVQMGERLLAAVDASVAEANQTPRGDLEQNITRMTTFVRGMAKRKIRRPGS
jgi:hypothetical protein